MINQIYDDYDEPKEFNSLSKYPSDIHSGIRGLIRVINLLISFKIGCPIGGNPPIIA